MLLLQWWSQWECNHDNIVLHLYCTCFQCKMFVFFIQTCLCVLQGHTWSYKLTLHCHPNRTNTEMSWGYSRYSTSDWDMECKSTVSLSVYDTVTILCMLNSSICCLTNFFFLPIFKKILRPFRWLCLEIILIYLFCKNKKREKNWNVIFCQAGIKVASILTKPLNCFIRGLPDFFPHCDPVCCKNHEMLR